ncbi:hypothetical protein BU14_0372s0006 [Porphyra umbilicalis]|uniref:Uncharacterized protein n=1 Tax=Porphyra umbilicalis TaxID=2786 RepID=A0A1X6NXA4_PORUM|nr:hypothetical protein BU14_0372s0006 [Porphyra umbilicalis]|eukprot:OSX73165.1 hypothetical protein BU14_0372s0006 [Porphyra umbilicalis]
MDIGQEDESSCGEPAALPSNPLPGSSPTMDLSPVPPSSCLDGSFWDWSAVANGLPAACPSPAYSAAAEKTLKTTWAAVTSSAPFPSLQEVAPEKAPIPHGVAIASTTRAPSRVAATPMAPAAPRHSRTTPQPCPHPLPACQRAGIATNAPSTTVPTEEHTTTVATALMWAPPIAPPTKTATDAAPVPTTPTAPPPKTATEMASASMPPTMPPIKNAVGSVSASTPPIAPPTMAAEFWAPPPAPTNGTATKNVANTAPASTPSAAPPPVAADDSAPASALPAAPPTMPAADTALSPTPPTSPPTKTTTGTAVTSTPPTASPTKTTTNAAVASARPTATPTKTSGDAAPAPTPPTVLPTVEADSSAPVSATLATIPTKTAGGTASASTPPTASSSTTTADAAVASAQPTVSPTKTSGDAAPTPTPPPAPPTKTARDWAPESVPTTAHATKTAADAAPAPTLRNPPLTTLAESSGATSGTGSAALAPRGVTPSLEQDEGVAIPLPLDRGGRGWVLTGDTVPGGWLDPLHRGCRRPSASTADLIFNFQPIEVMEASGAAGVDRGRRQVAVEGNGFLARAVRHIASSLGALVGDELGVTYDGVTPNLIIAMPRALAQLAHADTGRYVEVGGSGATLLTVYFSFEEGTCVDLWSGPMEGLLWGGRLSLYIPPSVSLFQLGVV